jgi:hypothetical protein
MTTIVGMIFITIMSIVIILWMPSEEEFNQDIF